MCHWLVKTEPEVYSIDDLKRDRSTCWHGVRNYQARNFMRDDMKVGDLVLIYHSNCEATGVVGVAKVCAAAYADHTALDRKSEYHDPKATRENPIWMMVDVAFVEKFPRVVTLAELKESKKLADMPLLQRGQRLSVQPVEADQFELIERMAHAL